MYSVLYFTQENQSKIYVNQGDFVVDSTLSCNNLWQKSNRQYTRNWRNVNQLKINKYIVYQKHDIFTCLFRYLKNTTFSSLAFC